MDQEAYDKTIKKHPYLINCSAQSFPDKEIPVVVGLGEDCLPCSLTASIPQSTWLFASCLGPEWGLNWGVGLEEILAK